MKTKLRMLAVAVPASALASGAAWADLAQGGGAGGYGHYPHMWGEWGWGGMFLGPLFGILFIAAIVVAILLVIRAIGGGVETDKARGGAKPPSTSWTNASPAVRSRSRNMRTANGC